MSHRIRLLLIAASVAVLTLAGAGTAAAGMPSYPHQSAGNRGADVRATQGFLRHHGTTHLGITGIYDPPTVAAVRAFQTAQGMPVTGMVNGPTWARFSTRSDGPRLSSTVSSATRPRPRCAHSNATRACRSAESSKARHGGT